MEMEIHLRNADAAVPDMKARRRASVAQQQQQQESEKGQSGLPFSSSSSVACCIPHPCFWFRLSISCLLLIRAQAASTDLDLSNSVVNSVRRLGVDSSLLKYAFLALSSSDSSSSSSSSSGTTVYNVTLTPFLRGIEAQAMRTDGKALTQQGLTFNEFSIPQGAEMDASADGAGDYSLILIYRKIFNFTVYTLPAQYQFAGPAVGIITYSPANFTTADPSLPQLHVTFPSSSRVAVQAPLFPATQNAATAGKLSPMCAFFFPNGTVSFSAVASMPNLCASDTFGSVDIALVLPSASSPGGQQQGSSPAALADFPSSLPRGRGSSSSSRAHWKLALGATALTLAGLALCIGVAIASAGLAEKVKVAILAHFADDEEALQTSLIGFSRAPTAGGVRTKPTLEMDMARF